jgi:uncharacterized protein YceH (UPF0502 family)
LDGLAQRELVVRLERRPGQKEERYAQLLGGDAGEEVTATRPVVVDDGGDRIAAIEQRLERVERGLDELRTRLDRYAPES